MIRFINQIRLIMPRRGHGEHKMPWEDACVGHDSYEAAVTCGELMSQTMKGECTQHDLIDATTLALTAWIGRIQNSMGTKREFRIIKRTTQEEVMQDA